MAVTPGLQHASRALFRQHSRVGLLPDNVISVLHRFLSSDSRPANDKSSRLAALRKRLEADGTAQPVTKSKTRATPSVTPASNIALEAPAGHPLVDTHDRLHSYLRISLTERCNLRCTYCMPADGISLTPGPELLTRDELSGITRLMVRQGVTKIRLTGGEPTLRADLLDIVSDLKSLPGLQTLGMTSNGVVLERLLPALAERGLTHLNISMDTLKRDKFAAITRRTEAHWDAVWSSIHAALKLGYGCPDRPLKVNVVVEQGVNADEIGDFVALTKNMPVQVRFIELMPFAGNGWRPEAVVSWKSMIDTLLERFPDFRPQDAATANVLGMGEAGKPAVRKTMVVQDTAKAWQVPGYTGSVGFITTMTSAFCSTCNRLRLTADGNLRTCLHGADNSEVSLRDVYRQCKAQGLAQEQMDARLLAVIASAVRSKHASLGGPQGLPARMNAARFSGGNGAASGRPMIKIGG